MNDFQKSVAFWQSAIIQCSLSTFVVMCGCLVAACSSWTEESVSHLHWWHWLVLVLSTLSVGAKNVMSYMDQTVGSLRKKKEEQDTQIIRRQDIQFQNEQDAQFPNRAHD